MKNCMEWFIAEQAIFCITGATVPFYDTLGPESVEFILNQTGTKTVVCTRGELERLCTVKASGKCPRFDTVILVDGVIPEAAGMAQKVGLEVMSFAKVEAIGAQTIATKGHKHRPPTGTDIFTFCYTSGTTGNPKGAILTHRNLISAVAGVSNVFPLEIWDRHLSYLPLAHIFERIIMCQVYIAGASIAFYRGDPLLLIEDIQACQPTIFPAAPRVLNKVYDKVSFLFFFCWEWKYASSKSFHLFYFVLMFCVYSNINRHLIIFHPPLVLKQNENRSKRGLQLLVVLKRNYLMPRLRQRQIIYYRQVN